MRSWCKYAWSIFFFVKVIFQPNQGMQIRFPVFIFLFVVIMLLQEEFDKPYFEHLVGFVKEEYARYTVFPPGSRIFHAYNTCPFEKVKVVILGQDPYHEPGQYYGLCFSVMDGVPFPPSLVNIFKEIQNDLGKPIPCSGRLERWADQGVLLINAILTVRAHQAGSHQGKGWEEFTDAVIR